MLILRYRDHFSTCYYSSVAGHETFTIAIADDEPVIRDGLCTGIPWGELGFRALEPCTNGEQLLQRTRSEPVDAVLTDIRMAPRSGIDVARVISREAPHIFIMFLTAHTDFDYAQSAIEYGVWRYVVKPIRYDEFLETLRELHRAISSARSEQDPAAGDKDQQDSAAADPFVQTVDRYLACHFNRASLKTVADYVDLSPEHLSRSYYRRSGRHFSDAVQAARMNHAARLLLQSRYRVAEIGRIVGYTSAKNFTRRFHRHFGTTPRDYRAKAGKSPATVAGRDPA